MLLRKVFTDRLFDGFSIHRWNDHLLPCNFTEMDRCGFKMIIAYFLGKKQEEEVGDKVDWDTIIYGGLFDLLKKVVLSDIKSTVLRRIRKGYVTEFRNLNEWVLKRYTYIIKDEDLITRFRNHLFTAEKENPISFQILRAAHRFPIFASTNFCSRSTKIGAGATRFIGNCLRM